MKSRAIRRRQWALRLVLVGTIGVLSLADRSGCLLAGPRDRDRYHLRNVTIVRVIDGDTLEIDIPDVRFDATTTRVRLWGIDCPEQTAAPQPFALEATRHVERLLQEKGRDVTLRLEAGRTRGHYGRLLAHVDLSDGSSLAEMLLTAGLARVDDRSPHSLEDRYRQLEWGARRTAAGMWWDEPGATTGG